MARTDSENAREKLMRAGIELIRRNGYVATTVDEICTSAGLTKGAFFHHFESKEALAEACLQQWDEHMIAFLEEAPFHAIKDPKEKLLSCIDYFTEFFSTPLVLKSCLAGTVVQEVSESNPVLREAAQACLATGERRFQMLLDEACRSQNVSLDTASLARHWMATLQGSLLLSKASRDESVIPENLRHFKSYIESLFCEEVSR